MQNHGPKITMFLAALLVATGAPAAAAEKATR